MYHRSVAVAIFYALVILMNSAHADVMFPDFSSTEGIQLNGNADHYVNRVRLTASAGPQGGSAWFIDRQSVHRGFDATFQFQISAPGGAVDPTGRTGGDGLAFVIQNSSVTALGLFGGYLGYGGTSGQTGIANSLAIEFDTWLNSDLNDPSSNHLSIHTRGTLPNSPDEAFSLGATTAIPDLKLGNIHTVEVQYDPGVMSVFMDDNTSAALTVPIDLAATLDLTDGQAWIGFTASTWSAWANHDILSASFTEVPEPSTLVSIDIKPGSDPNSINLGSNGNIPVAIFGTDTFDVTTVDLTTVMLADAGILERGKKGKLMASFEDIDLDGLLDLLVHIDTQSLVLGDGDVEALLTGETFSGVSISGTDAINLVGSSGGPSTTAFTGEDAHLLALSAVPEPSTITLLLCGLTGLALLRRRRK